MKDRDQIPNYITALHMYVHVRWMCKYTYAWALSIHNTVNFNRFDMECKMHLLTFLFLFPFLTKKERKKEQAAIHFHTFWTQFMDLPVFLFIKFFIFAVLFEIFIANSNFSVANLLYFGFFDISSPFDSEVYCNWGNEYFNNCGLTFFFVH